MHNRTYNKIFVDRNKEEGSEKIFLGYQNSTTEISLVKDNQTYFNIPPYTSAISIQSAALIINGATGGSFPAVSDRVYQSRKNYGNVSNNGTASGIPDGTWFCAWLYKDPVTGNQQWMDRYVGKKNVNFDLFDPETYNGYEYVLNALPSFGAIDNFFITDVPSSLVFEPSVLYSYFHIGEKTAGNIVSTFGGVSNKNLLLEINDWKSSSALLSSGAIPITINSSVSSSLLFPPVDTTQIVLSSVIAFDYNQNSDVYIDWDQNYIPTNDFTLELWCKSGDWSACPSTQLIGNYSNRGGFGVFVDTLSSFPFFVVPETTYGHVMFLNQECQGFTDKVVVSELSSLSLHIPKLVAIDSNDCLVVCSDGANPNLYKLDHLGNVLVNAFPSFSFLQNETPISLLVDQDDNVTVVTDQNTYVFDDMLSLISSTAQANSFVSSSAFSYSSTLRSFVVNTVNNALDLKYTGDDQWAVMNDMMVYKNGVPFIVAEGGITNIHIDPSGRLWALHGTNNVSVFETTESSFPPPVLTFTVGTDFEHTQKNISFLNVYDRNTLSSKWVSVIYYADEQYLYVNALDGEQLNVVDMTPFIDYKIARQLQQNPDQFVYGASGDFTGYERKRIFNTNSPSKQLTIKIALRDNLSSSYTYKTFKSSVAIEDWDPDLWKCVIVSHKNKTLSLYINSILQTSVSYSGRYSLSFDHQPSLYVGSPLGVGMGLNNELGSVTSIFNGSIGNIKLYNYCIDAKNYDMFLRSGIAAEDVIWSLPIPSVSYVEKVERLFKNKLPGSKSNFYNIQLAGTGITDLATRSIIEEQILNIVNNIAPASSDLVKVVWVS